MVCVRTEVMITVGLVSVKVVRARTIASAAYACVAIECMETFSMSNKPTGLVQRGAETVKIMNYVIVSWGKEEKMVVSVKQRQRQQRDISLLFVATVDFPPRCCQTPTSTTINSPYLHLMESDG